MLCGHPGGTATYEIGPALLDEAIAAMTPALACTDVPHPNVAAWHRSVRERLAADDDAYAARRLHRRPRRPGGGRARRRPPPRHKRRVTRAGCARPGDTAVQLPRCSSSAYWSSDWWSAESW
ncbi:hypothetical protein ACU686_41450 [Yinghuangia aomiensis]